MIKVGLILFSVREHMIRDPMGAVEAVAKLGYKNIEVCNHDAMRDYGCGFGIGAEELKAKFDAYGSRVVSAHIFPFEKTDLDQIIAYNAVLGNHNIVNPSDLFTTYDALMRQCEVYNRRARYLYEAAGMRMLYHNHTQEFRTFGGRTILDLMMENTDPQYVGLELDTFWTMRAGLNPTDMLRHFGKRVKLLHQKDFAWDSLSPINLLGLDPAEREMQPGQAFGVNGDSEYAKTGGKGRTTPLTEEEQRERFIEESAYTEIGDGIMDIQGIIDTATECCDVEYIILEQDATRMPTQMDSIARSMESFRKFRNISWDN